MAKRKIKRVRSKLTLSQQLEGANSNLASYRDRNKQVEYELVQHKDRIKQIAAENETLRQDIKWYKSLIQHLVSGGKDGQPR